jgi:hypothetical protein
MRLLSLVTISSCLFFFAVATKNSRHESDEVLQNRRNNLSPLPNDVVKARAVAAIVGGFLADAAAMPLHWIYDVNEIAKLVG